MNARATLDIEVSLKKFLLQMLASAMIATIIIVGAAGLGGVLTAYNPEWLNELGLGWVSKMSFDFLLWTIVLTGIVVWVLIFYTPKSKPKSAVRAK